MGSFVVGKRTKVQTKQLVHDAKARLRVGHLPALFSEGYAGYAPAILEACGRRYPAPQSGGKGRPSRPKLRWPQEFASGQVIKSAKEHPPDGINLKVIRGTARLQHVLSFLGHQKMNTSTVERHNGTSRWRNQRKVRRTLAFSKSTRYHEWMRWVSMVQYNFCRAHGSLRVKDESGAQHRTPAMASGLTTRIWSTRDWLLIPVLGGEG